MRYFLLILIFVFNCSPKVVKHSYRVPSKEEMVAREALDLTEHLDMFPPYERKQVYKRLNELRIYILKQFLEIIEKHTKGIEI